MWFGGTPTKRFPETIFCYIVVLFASCAAFRYRIVSEKSMARTATSAGAFALTFVALVSFEVSRSGRAVERLEAEI